KVVDVVGVNQAVHGGVDRRRRTTLAVQAEVECRDHLVFTLLARIDRYQITQTVQAKNSEPFVGQRGQVAARAFYPDELDLPPSKRVCGAGLGRGVPARIIRIARVFAEPVGAVQELRY